MPETQPALRSLADHAGGRHHQQQQDAERIQPRRQAAQKVRTGMRQRQHGGAAEGESHDRAHDGLGALSRGAIEDHQPVDGQQRERDQQRAIEVQCQQQPRPAESVRRVRAIPVSSIIGVDRRRLRGAIGRPLGRGAGLGCAPLTARPAGRAGRYP